MTGTRSVDDLRARLRDLGYLDAGVDRFVLGPVGTRGLLSAAWRSSARIGLAGGLLLGPSTALALGIRVQGLVTGWRDAVVLASYLGAFFAAGLTALTFLAALLLGASASRLRRPVRTASRAARLSAVAAGVVAGGCLVYLVAWWRAVSSTGPAWYASPWTWPVLAGAAVVSLLLGHAVRVTTLGLIAQAGGIGDLARRPPARSWAARFALAALAFAAATGLLAALTLGDGGRSASGAVPQVVPTPTGAAVTVVAVDGLDLPFLERLAAAGRLPAFSRLLAGARATLPASDAPDPARTWTSIATGQPADIHGIGGIAARRVSGIGGTVTTGSSGLVATIAAATDLIRLTTPALTTSLQRRSRTFWEVAADAGIPTVVVNWWATWPVAQGRGVVLSDRATLRLDVGGVLDGEIAPPGLYAGLRRQWPAWRADARRRVVEALGEGGDPASASLRRAADQDSAAVELATRVAPGSRGLRTTYLPGLDIAQHDLVGVAAGGLPPSAMAARIEALERYYEFLDGLVSRLVAGAGAGDLVVLLADPGRSPSRGAGLLVLAGGPARAGQRIEIPRDDVTPTLLYALGLPVSRDLPGRPRRELFAEAFAGKIPLRTVDTFGAATVAPRPPDATPLDQQMLDRLRSLGYVR